MVETPLRRRSRRIQSQSDDEASVASSTRSGGSRTRSSSKAASTSAPSTRRSTRSSAVEKTTELEAIPETITAGNVVDVGGDGEATNKSVEATPAKSAKKKKTKATPKGKESKVEESKEKAAESKSEVAPTPAKSAKKTPAKSTKKTPAKSAKKSKASSNVVGKEGTAEPTDADDGGKDGDEAVVSETPSKSAKKKKKAKTPPPETKETPQTKVEESKGEESSSKKRTSPKNRKSLEAQQAKSPPKSPGDDVNEDAADALMSLADAKISPAAPATPSTSAKKKRKKKDKTPAKDESMEAGKQEEPKATPSTSAKKKSKTPAKDESVEAANLEESKATPSTSAKKKKKKKTPAKNELKEEVKQETSGATAPAKGVDSEPATSASPPAEADSSRSDKKKKKRSKQKDKKKADAAGDDSKEEVLEQASPTSPPAVPSSSKKKKKHDNKAAEMADKSIDVDVIIGEEDVIVSEVPRTTKSDKKKKEKREKKKRKAESQDEAAGIPAVSGDDTSEPAKKKKKKKKKKTASEPSKKKKRKTELQEEAAGNVPESIEETSDPTEPAKKKERERKNRGQSADATQNSEVVQTSKEEAAESAKTSKNKMKRGKQKDDEQAAESVKTRKNRTKRGKQIDNEQADEDSPAPETGELAFEPTSTTPKKRKNKNKEDEDTASEPAPHRTGKNEKKRKRAMPGASDSAAGEPTDNAPSSKSQPEAQEAKPSGKSPQKEDTKKKEAKKKSSKKHKSNKHDHPTVSPRPKGRQPKAHQVQSHPTESPKLVMDAKVHRVRFLKLHPKSILAMASAPTSSANQQGLRAPARLAIAREGGSVELLSPQDRWVSVGDVPGVRGREVDALVWVVGKRGTDDKSVPVASSSLATQDSHHEQRADEQRRLFGCSRDGTIFELDFGRKRQKGVIGSGGGGVFCLASCAGGCNGYFAAGCEDGSIKIYSAFGSDGEETVSGSPQLVATLPSAGNAVLSLAWVSGQSSGSNEGGMGGSVIFAGVADGTIRRFDCLTSATTGSISTGSVLAPSRGSVSVSYRWKSTLRMTVENQGLRESTKVWTLQALSDGTVISGDSLGHVQIWDGTSGTMTQTFDHNESGADVLCLAVSEDENKIFASGIDSSVRCYQRQCLPNTEKSSVGLESVPMRKWISSNSHRKHSHDVKALAICHKETGNKAKPLELLVSGGVDTRICTYITKDYKSSRPKIWYNWPTLSPVTLSRKQRIIAVTRENSIDLYQLDGTEVGPRDETKCLIKTISIQSPFNLSCSAISDDGKFLAASDAVSLYVFALEVVNDDGILDVRPSQLGIPVECKQPATALKFGDAGRLILATNNGQINVLRVSHEDITLKHVFKEHTEDWSASSHHFPIICLDLSSDGKWLAAGRFSAGKGAVHVFTLPTNEEGRYQHWWAVPKMDTLATCVKFLGGGNVESSLAVGCSSNEFYVYNLGRRSLSHWSNDMGLPLLKSLPKELTSRSEPVARIVSNPISPQRLILVSGRSTVLLTFISLVVQCIYQLLLPSFRGHMGTSVMLTWIIQCLKGHTWTQKTIYELSASSWQRRRMYLCTVALKEKSQRTSLLPRETKTSLSVFNMVRFSSKIISQRMKWSL